MRGTRVTEAQFHNELERRLLADPQVGGRLSRRDPVAGGFDAAQVDEAWRQIFDRTRSWMSRTDQLTDGWRHNPRRIVSATPTLAAVLSIELARLFYTAAHPADALLRLRAAQAALFRDGLLLHHEPRLARETGDGLRCRLNPTAAATISRTISTTAAAAAVVYLVDPLARTPRLRPQPWQRDYIEPDGSQLHTEHGPVPVPACARPILRAHLNWIDPTSTETNPFVHAKNLGDLAAQALRPLRLGGGSELRYRRSRSYPRGYSTTWMQERGLELCPLAELAPREQFR